MKKAEASTILLASGSPRRSEILKNAGFQFTVVSTQNVEELDQGAPAKLAVANARLKCNAASAPKNQDIVLGADTVVALGSEVMGKPKSAAESERMLQSLSGNWHRVVTGLCIKDAKGNLLTRSTSTRVHFREIPKSWMKRYIAGGEGVDKAGSYGIQGAMAVHVDKISGCYFNVMGLSPAVVWEAIEALTGDADRFLSKVQ